MAHLSQSHYEIFRFNVNQMCPSMELLSSTPKRTRKIPGPLFSVPVGPSDSEKMSVLIDRSHSLCPVIPFSQQRATLTPLIYGMAWPD